MLANTTKEKEAEGIEPVTTVSSDRIEDVGSVESLEKRFLNDPENYPDGGREAYTVLFGAFLALTGVLGVVNAIGPIENYVSSKILNTTPQSTIAWIFSVFNFASFALGIFVGPLFDQLGARIMTTIGFGAFTAGIMCFSASTEFYQFLLSFVLCGVGNSFLFVTCVSTLNHWFFRKRATALGISYCGGGLGGMIVPIILRSLFGKIGFGWSIRVVGFIFSGFIGISIFLIKDRRKELGIGNTVESENRFLKALKNIDFLCFKDRTYTLLTIACIGNSSPFFLILTYLVSYASATGMNSSAAFYLVIALNGCSIIGRLCGGLLADRYGRFNYFVLINFISCIAIFVVLLPAPIGHSTAGLYLFSCIYGFTSGSYLQSSPTCLGQISKTEDFSKRYGTFSCVISSINLAMVPIGGAIVKTQGNLNGFDNLVRVVAGISFMGLVMSIACRIDHAGLKWTVA